MNVNKQKLEELFDKHFPKTIEFWDALGLDADTKKALRNSHIEKQVDMLNYRLRRIHVMKGPVQIELEDGSL